MIAIGPIARPRTPGRRHAAGPGRRSGRRRASSVGHRGRSVAGRLEFGDHQGDSACASPNSRRPTSAFRRRVRRNGAHRPSPDRGARSARPRRDALRERRLRDRRRAPQRHAPARPLRRHRRRPPPRRVLPAGERPGLLHRRGDGAFDIVHNHAGLEGLVLAAHSRTPVLTTNHNPFVPQTQPIWDAYPWAHHAVSQASAATFPSRGALPPIHHGIDVASFPFGERPEGYLLFLGRFSPEKGAARAIDAAARRGPAAHPGRQGRHGRRRALRSTTIEPRIDGERIRYVGEADATTKRRAPRRRRRPPLPDRVGRAVRSRDDRGAVVRDAGHRAAPGERAGGRSRTA